jgi:hypothetical protein
MQQWALTEDVSAGGVGLELPQKVLPGQALLLELPLPSRLREYDPDAPMYRAYGIVRNAHALGDGYRAGVQLLGRTPPQGYDRHPGALFLHADDAPHPLRSALEGRDPWERRHCTRFQILVNLVLQKKGATGDVEREELTVADDLGRDGLRVRTTIEAIPGDVLTVKHPESGFEARVGVCDSWVAGDGVRRLNLAFLDGKTGEPLIGQ